MQGFKKALASGALLSMAAILGAFVPAVFAEEGSLGVDVKASATVGTSTEGGGRVQANVEEQAETNTGVTDDNSTGTEERTQHQSEVAARVQVLLSAAARDGGIGAEVRAIAHEYASSSEDIDSAESKVDGRPAWMTFIIGSDYKNLGALRSEIVTTSSQIKRLTAARDRSADPVVQADLSAQIAVLADTASTTDAYVKAHEGSFSLLGWLFKLFNS